MSRLDELLRELCPNGVAYTNLDTVCTIGKGIQFNKKDMKDSGSFPVINGGINPSGFIEQYNQEENTITISQGGASAGFVNWIDTKFWAGAHCYVLKPTDKILNRYLYHFVKAQEHKLQECQYGAGIPALAKSTVSGLVIPVPPLEVQSEIVRILDNFTELTARKKQYKYYCRHIIESAENAEFVSIGDWGKWSGGSTPSMANSTFWENGTIPWVSSKDMKTAELLDTDDHVTEAAIANTSLKMLPKNVVAIVARSGILKHTLPIVFIPIEVTVNQDIKALICNERVLPKYAFYALQGYHDELLAKTKKQGGTVDSLEIQKFMNFEIPVPSISEQQRIIHVLDRFNTLCNDISNGLPAEIEARQKQYEYYRDKLLTFKEIS